MDLFLLGAGAGIFLGAAAQTFAGFGLALVAGAILSLFLDVRTVVPLVVFESVVVYALQAFHLRRHLEAKRIFLLLIGALLGLPGGITFLASMEEKIVRKALGTLLILFAIREIVAAGGRPRQRGRGWAFVAGVAAGALGGAFGTFGPPVVLYTSSQPWPRDQLKAIMVSFFLIAYTGTFLAYMKTGLFFSGAPFLGVNLV